VAGARIIRRIVHILSKGGFNIVVRIYYSAIYGYKYDRN
jgi:hypothetical protein